MNGLLKAYITDAKGFEFNTDRNTHPDMYGVTLAYVNLPPEDADAFRVIVDAVVNYPVTVRAYGRLSTHHTTSLLVEVIWPLYIGELASMHPHEKSVTQALFGDYYFYVSHLTECYDSTVKPVRAAIEATHFCRYPDARPSWTYSEFPEPFEMQAVVQWREH